MTELLWNKLFYENKKNKKEFSILALASFIPCWCLPEAYERTSQLCYHQQTNFSIKQRNSKAMCACARIGTGASMPAQRKYVNSTYTMQVQVYFSKRKNFFWRIALFLEFQCPWQLCPSSVNGQKSYNTILKVSQFTSFL